MIRIKKLIKETTVTGQNFLGQKSSITFKPAGRPGWYLETEDGQIPINHKIAFSKRGRLQLRYKNTVLEVIEHILALKMLIGLDEVVLVVHKKWPPYLGGAGGYAEQLKDCWIQTWNTFETIQPTEKACIELDNKLNTEVSIRKSFGDPKTLTLEICGHWHPLPSYHQKITLDNEVVLKYALESKPQGFPTYREYLADLVSFFGWKNKKFVSWVSHYKNPEDASYAWWCHAVQDCLGELALCHHKKIPEAYVLRWCAGHKQTLEAVKKSF